jgi:tetratricopeptide (TPR) repeat protein
MKLANDLKIESPNNQRLLRLVYLMLALATLLTIAFASYYYLDRYVHRGDMSPIELGVTHLEQAIQDNPNDPDVRLALASHYIESGDYSSAITQAQQVLDAYPDDLGALFLLGVARTSLGQYEAANQSLERYVTLRMEAEDVFPDQVLETSLYYLGKNYNSLGQPLKAIETLTKALSVDHTDADALYQLGLAYTSDGQHDQAIDSFQNAVQFVPDFTEAYQEMEASYTALNLSSQADYARGMEAFSQGKYPLALKYLEGAAPGLTDFSPLYWGLALVYEKSGDDLKALESAQRALILDPNNILANDILHRLK